MPDLALPREYEECHHAVTSLPWPAHSGEPPSAEGIQGIRSQVVPLFDGSESSRLQRFLFLCETEDHLPKKIRLPRPERQEARGTDMPIEPFSEITMEVLSERLDIKECGGYVYQEGEARIRTGAGKVGLRMGLLPAGEEPGPSGDFPSWWQWCRAERLWSGPVAEAWRIGGHMVPYARTTLGHRKERIPSLYALGDQIATHCGDALHGDLFVIVWRSGLLQITAHFKAGYFHYWPKAIAAFPVLYVEGEAAAASLTFPGSRDRGGVTTQSLGSGTLIQPWDDLRVVTSKTKENELTYLEPAKPDVLPAGVSRSFRLHMNLTGGSTEVARYHIPASWYKQCRVVECDQIGPVARMATGSADLIREHTVKTGFDAGRTWRYLRRDARTGVPQEDCADWDGNLAQAMFHLAYQTDESPADWWDLYLHQAYHTTDVGVYHGSWMPRLEGSVAMTAPLPKFRIGGMVAGYLETGDPYLLEMARSVAGVYMAMESANQPRSAIGRDAYPLVGILSLWDYTNESQYLNFARRTALRLLSTQNDDGGFAGQGGVGVLSGASSLQVPESISFGSGLLAPIALFEWAVRDRRWQSDTLEKFRKWADLMVKTQQKDGLWLNAGSRGTPYPLIGGGAVFSLTRAGQLLEDPRCLAGVARFVDAMNASGTCISGTHSLLPCLYAHVADAALLEGGHASEQNRAPATREDPAAVAVG